MSEPSEVLPFCKDCDHYRTPYGHVSPKCERAVRIVEDLVRGSYTRIGTCFEERKSTELESCGREGKFFLARQIKPPISPLTRDARWYEWAWWKAKLRG